MEFITQYGYLIFLVVLMVAMYVFTVLPQKKREKQIQQLRNNLEVGDIVVMQDGLVGRVISTKDVDTITIETGADKTKLKFKRWAVMGKEKE